MYLSHFGLTEEPFSIVPNPKFLYLSERHKEAIAHIKSGIAAGGGFAMLTGEVGTGKTLVCKSVLEELSASIQVALVVNPKLSENDLLLSICEQFGCDIDFNRPLVEQLKQHLTKLFDQGSQPLLVVDEAHHLSVVALEQLRLLTNFEIGPHKLLKVWLIGQPELQQRLQTVELRQLAQRITGRYHLLELQPQEVEAYVQHRLTRAGSNQPILPNAVTKQIAKAARVPRLINLIADKALQLAYMAGESQVSKQSMSNAIESIMAHQYQQPSALTPQWRVKPLVIAIVALCAFGGAAAWWAASQQSLLVDTPQADTSVVDAVTTVDTALVDTAMMPNSPSVASEVSEVANQTEAVEVNIVESPHEQPMQVEDVVPATNLATVPQWLEDIDPRFNSEITAMQRLFQLWGYQASIMASSCEQVPLPFRCVTLRGSWEQVLQTQRPVILTLNNESQSSFAVVYAVHGDAVDLLFDEARLRVKQSWVAQYWDGEYIALWYSPLQAPLKQGQQGEQIQLLEDQISRALSEPTRLNVTYDEILGNKVKAFQLWKGLDVDGVVGNQTLKALDKAANGSAPSISLVPIDAEVKVKDEPLRLMLPTIQSLASLSVSESQAAERVAPLPSITAQETVTISPNQPANESFNLDGLNLDELDPDIARMVANAIENTPEVGSTGTSAVPTVQRVTIEQADPQLTDRLPTLNFQTHMYASDPLKRWVKINGQEVQQGEWVDEVKVVEIAPRHVVVEFDEQEIEFPALFEWR